jgi:F-type H+-transporting ATPase subunit gamma
MEMVSTVKMKKMQNRLLMSKPYSDKVEEIIHRLVGGGVGANIDLLRPRDNPRKALILLIAGNRGLCGGFNTAVAETALDHKDALLAKGFTDVSIYAFGKKANNYLRFLKEPIFKSGANPEDKLTFSYSSDLGIELVDLFRSGSFDEIYLVYTHVVSSASQKPTALKLLPVSNEGLKTEHKAVSRDYIFEPQDDEILAELIPLYLRVRIFSSFLESGFSEQFARRIAMKNANDAAADIVRTLTVTYNRVRQAKITNEISEIVSGAAAIE